MDTVTLTVTKKHFRQLLDGARQLLEGGEDNLMKKITLELSPDELEELLLCARSRIEGYTFEGYYLEGDAFIECARQSMNDLIGTGDEGAIREGEIACYAVLYRAAVANGVPDHVAERPPPEAEAEPEAETEAAEQPEAVIERIPIPAPSRTAPGVLPFTLPEVAWMTGDDRFPEDQIRQASLNLEFHWRQTVLDADSRFEAQAIALSLLSYVETHRECFREQRLSTPHIAELKKLIPYHRWKLDYLNGDCECPKENRPEIIPIARLYAEAAHA